MKTIFLALLITSPAQAANPIYKNDPPKTFCEAGAAIDRKAQSCSQNRAYLDAANKCWKKLEDLEKRVTKELEARIGMKGVGQQQTTFQNSRSTYEESSEAYAYLLAAAHTGLKEIDEYFDFVNYPDHAEGDEEIMAEPCYKDTVVPMNDVADKFEEKTAQFTGKIESADEHAEQLSGQESNLDSTNPAGMAKTKDGAAPGPKAKDWRESDISGTKEKPKK